VKRSSRGKPPSPDVAKVARLQELPPGSGEQVRAATALLQSARTLEATRVALGVLTAAPSVALRPLLLAKYAACDADGVKHDPGGLIRITLLETLRPLVLPEDTALLERAATTYEFLFGEATGDLRAAALLVLDDADDGLASFHCVRLLVDEYTSTMSGEPAVTAARILAAQGQILPLYAYVTQASLTVADVVAECLRGLVALPVSLLPSLVERYVASEDEIVLLGLFDLLLARDDRDEYRDTIIVFLRATALHNIYRYLVSALIAGRDPITVDALAALADVERDQLKREILRDALELR
jgi:hypothetical protein